MAEVSTEENEQIVAAAYEKAMTALHNDQPITDVQRVLYGIEHMMQEVNSGASYEQYFRWASLEEIRSIAQQLMLVGLSDVANITTKAIAVAFPKGMPSTEEEKSDATEWTREQEVALGNLFAALEEQNGRVTNILGVYAKRVGV